MTETAVIPHTQCIEVKISHILRSSLVSPCYAINSRTCNRLALDLAEGCYYCSCIHFIVLIFRHIRQTNKNN